MAWNNIEYHKCVQLQQQRQQHKAQSVIGTYTAP